MNMAMQKEYEVYSISGPENLPGKIVGTEKETTSETFLKNSGCDLRTFDRIDEAYKSLEAKKLDAVVFDMPTIMYLIKNDKKKKFKISGGVFDRQMYGFALKKESQ
jgi:polar amino acid transport system substrate-binding protein